MASPAEKVSTDRLDELARAIDIDRIRADFPILGIEHRGNRLVYLDNAATSQTPRQVVDAIQELRAEKDAEIESLRRENDELRQRLDRIERLLGS